MHQIEFVVKPPSSATIMTGKFWKRGCAPLRIAASAIGRRAVSVDGREVQLTPTEYDLLRTLVKHAGKVLTHDQLLRAVAAQAGLRNTIFSAQALHSPALSERNGCGPEGNTTYAEIQPDDKRALVETYRRAGCTTGLTGSGLQEIQALRQAERDDAPCDERR